MSHFYGTLRGHRGEATRCGSKSSGVAVRAASWEGAVHARVFYNEEAGKDWAYVGLTKWRGRGVERELYNGPVDGSAHIPREQLRLLVNIADKQASRPVVSADKKTVRLTIPKAIYDEICELVLRKVVNA